MPSDLTTLDPDVLAHVVGALVVMTPDGEIVSWDRGAEILFGFSAEEALHHSIFDLVIPAERAAETREQMKKALAIGAAVYESERSRKDGSSLPVGVSMRPLKDAEGRTLIAKNDRDITERQTAKDALRRSEARLKSVLDAALDAVVMMDEQGRVTSWNVRAEALFGWSHDEAVGRVLADLIIPPRYREAHARGLARFLEAGEGPVIGRRIELSAVRRDGSEFPVELTVTALKEKGAYFFSAFLADITERKDAEEALREAQHRLQHVVSSSPAVLYSLAVEDHTLRPRWVSANVERLTGYTPAEVSSADWWADRVHPDDRERVMAQVAPLLEAGSVVRDYRFRHKDGSYRWVRDEQILIARTGEPDEVVGSWSDVTAQKDAELRLEESEEQYRLLFDNNPYPMWVFDVESLAFLAVNDAAVRHYGWTRDEFLRMRLSDIRPPETLPAFMTDIATVRDEPGPHEQPGLWQHRKKDGTEIDVEIVARSIFFQGRRARLTLAADVTEKTLLQAQLVKAQKMEAVGQLAGGVAHDFNNLLGVITGYCELLIRELRPDSRERKRAEEIQRASDRAAALTRQLLAFSRRQVLQPKVLDLNEIVADVDKMMRRLISESIQIVTVATANLGKVRGDAGQIEQVIMNLAINARDAMPSGGRLVIETGNVELDETYVRTHPEARPGPHVMLALSDTGHGMDAKTMARIFEPFFTTKEEGKGTGLGLATVYGIVRQSGGTVNVYSEPGRGTTFKVYLPRIEGDTTAEAGPAAVAAPGGLETVLLVEDAEALRLLVRELLENAGYTVLEADTPDTALSMVESTPGPIHLLLTDLVMPRMNGQELAGRIAALKPEARVVFMSGYSDQAMGDQSTLEPGALFLQKPFTVDALLTIIRRALDAAPPTDGGRAK